MRKLNVTILIGVIAALLGFVIVFGYGHNVDKRVADGRETVKVLVAKETVAAGATPADLAGKLVPTDVPRAYLAEGALTDLKSVAGMVLLGPLPKGEQVTAAQFGLPSAAGAVRPVPGHVALAVGVSITPGVARYITPGSSVDVFVTYTGLQSRQGQSGNQPGQPDITGRTKLFESNVKVLSVSVAEPVTSDGKKGSSQSDQANQGAQVVAVLDVTPEDAEKIVNAATLGNLYLALASLDGKSTPHRTTGVTPQDVVGSNR